MPTVAPAVSAAVDIPQLFARQQARSTALRHEAVEARAARLRKLGTWITTNRTAIQEALHADFRKPAAETDITEIWSSQTEIRHTLKHLKQWMRPRRVRTPLSLVGTTSWVQVEPKGVCLIIAPWNYPFYLAIDPLVSALAAGNCCILKPSEMTPHVATLLTRMVRELFDPAEVAVVEGDKDVATELLGLPFDHIFFTGSPQVGKVVMRAAAEHLTSVTLELGGKSPAVVDETADLRDAAEKIVWGKSINAGQTCVAPDYLLVHESVQAPLLQEIRAVLQRFYNPTGQGVAASESFARIVNGHHFQRLAGLLEDAQRQGAKLEIGGIVDQTQCFIEPTVLTHVPPDSRLMQEEIFGPLLPVHTFRTLMEATDFVNSRPRPLALYVFSQSSQNQQYLLGHMPAGGACVNETILHLGHPELPFGGLGNSGMGRAHGHAGFLQFSNEKAVLRQRVGRTALKAMYPPYTPQVKKLVGWLLKFF
ncbi:aldehyde dehydrogenase family protein [Hymenobacter busanensis]|uniref:Aldehyde dehydrogenase n=1 Tax=Hymenobacter busanensis TaxID=2607656 RepID=A0A7L4ZXQ8_9BACT|nr:aldehyde dehydrogenase family protein [Hymenobacter busanensis]KAA9333272.1 aldehyde dehydrogenase family protein [Hymenobacter busanensis]QHJ08051.1 aldehyde dehydrogenase family protein [Hymenobacter busanensis]